MHDNDNNNYNSYIALYPYKLQAHGVVHYQHQHQLTVAPIELYTFMQVYLTLILSEGANSQNIKLKKSCVVVFLLNLKGQVQG